MALPILKQAPSPNFSSRGGRAKITIDRLKEVLHYDPETGIWTWVKTIYTGEHHTKVNVAAGAKAGCVVEVGISKTKYLHIRIDRQLYPAHSLAWFYMTGEWVEMVDHKDLDGLNNRWANLRPCDKSQNAANTRAPKNNSSGFKGVSWDSSRSLWAVEIRCQGKRYRLGRFSLLADAAAAYAEKSKQLFGEFSRAA